MSNEQQSNVAEVEESPVRIIKNPNTGGELPLYKEVLKRKRDGVPEERVYFCSRFNSLEDAVKFWGEETVLDVFSLDLTRRARKWTADATDEKTGVTDESDFDRMFVDYSARSESISEIRDRIHSLATETLRNIFSRTDLDPMQKGLEAQKVSERIRKLNQDIKNKRRKTPEDEQALASESDNTV